MAFLGSIGMAITYGLKVNLSVAMVAMLNHTAIAELNAKNAINSSSLLLNGTQHSSNEEECHAPGGTGNETHTIEVSDFLDILFVSSIR